MIRYSLVICCYNSDKIIEDCLNAILKQVGAVYEKMELIIVDNCSIDRTVEVANIVLGKQDLISYQIVPESKPGLSNARRRGWEVSRGEYIIFIDDDNFLRNNFLEILDKVVGRDFDIYGSQGFPVVDLSSENCNLVYDNLLLYACGPQFPGGSRDITYDKSYVYGACSIYKRTVLTSLYTTGFTFLLTDRLGGKLISGGDNELGYLAVASGFRIYYCEDLKFDHFVSSKKVNLKYILDLNVGQGLTYDVIFSYLFFLSSKKNFFLFYIISLFESLSHVFRFWFLGFVVSNETKRVKILLNYKKHFIRLCLFLKNPLTTLKNIIYVKKNVMRAKLSH